MATQVVPFDELTDCDLVVDAVYLGGTSGSSADDPLSRILPCGNMGGFRKVGKGLDPRLVVLYSSLADHQWPDRVDIQTGSFTYFGDNKKPGCTLHGTPRRGNLLLSRAFELAHSGPAGRSKVAPFFVFTKAAARGGRAVQFRGLAVPGYPGLGSRDDLVSFWMSRGDERFQNYRSTFSILDVPVVRREWLERVIAGNPGIGAPIPLTQWWSDGVHDLLRADPESIPRDIDAQLPGTADRWEVLNAVHSYFGPHPHRFEYFAADIVQFLDANVLSTEVTRPSRDGGRDAIGIYQIGPKSDRIRMQFAIEAKCYDPGYGVRRPNTVGVRDLARLVSRLRHRQFGFLVTTSAVARQAYREIREDGHPIAIVSGADIVDLLWEQGATDLDSTLKWLIARYGRDSELTAADR